MCSLPSLKDQRREAGRLILWDQKVPSYQGYPPVRSGGGEPPLSLHKMWLKWQCTWTSASQNNESITHFQFFFLFSSKIILPHNSPWMSNRISWLDGICLQGHFKTGLDLLSLKTNTVNQVTSAKILVNRSQHWPQSLLSAAAPIQCHRRCGLFVLTEGSAVSPHLSR